MRLKASNEDLNKINNPTITIENFYEFYLTNKSLFITQESNLYTEIAIIINSSLKPFRSFLPCLRDNILIESIENTYFNAEKVTWKTCQDNNNMYISLLPKMLPITFSSWKNDKLEHLLKLPFQSELTISELFDFNHITFQTLKANLSQYKIFLKYISDIFTENKLDKICNQNFNKDYKIGQVFYKLIRKALTLEDLIYNHQTIIPLLSDILPWYDTHVAYSLISCFLYNNKKFFYQK